MAWIKMVVVCIGRWDVPSGFSSGIKDLAASSDEADNPQLPLRSRLLSGNASAEESYSAQGSCPFSGMARIQ